MTRLNSEDDDDCSSKTDETTSAKKTPSDAAACFQTGLQWLETQDVDSIMVMQLRRIVDFAKSRQARALKQSTLGQFFSKSQ